MTDTSQDESGEDEDQKVNDGEISASTETPDVPDVNADTTEVAISPEPSADT